MCVAGRRTVNDEVDELDQRAPLRRVHHRDLTLVEPLVLGAQREHLQVALRVVFLVEEFRSVGEEKAL